jgi:hypothetical protein
MVEQITYNNVVIAILIRSEHKKDGVEFFTPHSFSQQLGYMKRPKGYIVEPHTHRIVERKVSNTQEVLHVKSGRVKLTLFGNDKAFIKEIEIKRGDTVLLASGGHSVEMLEDSELIEIKQGPYLSDEDKVMFTPVMAHNDNRDCY